MLSLKKLMIRNSYFVIRLVVILCLSSIFNLGTPLVFAQYDQLTSLPASVTCDLCGRCLDANNVEQKPTDWARCRRCLYRNPADLNNTSSASTDPSNPDFVNYRPVDTKTWTPIGCIDFDFAQPTGFIQTVLRFVIGIAGGLAFLGFLWGGFQLATSSGDPIRVSGGKSVIIGSLGALILIVFSIFILNFIGFNILQLPGFRR